MKRYPSPTVEQSILSWRLVLDLMDIGYPLGYSTTAKDRKEYQNRMTEIVKKAKEIVNRTAKLESYERWNLLFEDSDGSIHGLPGDDGQYLMTDGKDIWIDEYVDGVSDGISLDSGRDIREIKAWMYLPNLPN